MCDTILKYGHYRKSLWDFATMQIHIAQAVEQIELVFIDKGSSQNENVHTKKINKVIDCISECDIYIERKVFSELKYKGSIQRFLNEKSLGSIEQMQAELTLRYQAK